MSAEENSTVARKPISGGWYVLATLSGIAAVLAYDAAMLPHYTAMKGWGWIFFFAVPACVILLGAFAIGRAFKETGRLYWISAFAMSVLIPVVALAVTAAGYVVAMLCALLFPEWGDRCDIGRTDLPCSASSQTIWQTYGELTVAVRFGALTSPNPNATVAFLQHSAESPAPDVTDIAIRLGNGPYRNLTCDIEPEMTNNGWYRRTTCQVADPKWLLSLQEPDTLTVRFNVDQSTYERSFRLGLPRTGFGQVQQGKWNAKPRPVLGLQEDAGNAKNRSSQFRDH